VAAVSDRSTVRLRGQPSVLTGQVILPEAGPRLVPIQLSLDDRATTTVLGHLLPVGTGGLCTVEISLPTWTAPGSYRGTMRVGDEERHVVVDVDAKPRLRAEPRLLTVRARPRETARVEVLLSNEGNVTAEVRRAYAFALYDPSTVELATATAFLSKETTGQGFTDQLVAKLREGFAGMARLKVDEGAGPLPPGDGRPIEATLHLPDGLRSGRTYEGTWRIDALGYNVVVEALDGTATEEIPR
jgi:hypothetical protein